MMLSDWKCKAQAQTIWHAASGLQVTDVTGNKTMFACMLFCQEQASKFAMCSKSSAVLQPHNTLPVRSITI